MNAKELNAVLDEDVRLFTFPRLKVEIKYSKPDILDAAIRNELPGFINEPILAEMKAQLKGKHAPEINLDDKEFTDAEIAEFVAKARLLLKKLALEPKFGDVSTDETVAVSRIKTDDCMAFLSDMMIAVRESQVERGGTITSEEVSNFPKGKRGK